MSKDREQSGSASVLMQRVIALNGVLDSANKNPKSVVSPPPAPLFHKQPLDLGATALEWGPQQVAAKREPAVETKPAEEPPEAPPDAPGVQAPKDPVDAQWATHSSIALRPYDDLMLSQSILSLNIEDAVTAQYNPAAADLAVTTVASSTDLASLDCVLESAGALQDNGYVMPLLAAPKLQPDPPETVTTQMLLVPASVAWAVLGAFALCVLALAYLVAAVLVCGQPAAFDLRSLRCVPHSDVVRVH